MYNQAGMELRQLPKLCSKMLGQYLQIQMNPYLVDVGIIGRTVQSELEREKDKQANKASVFVETKQKFLLKKIFSKLQRGKMNVKLVQPAIPYVFVSDGVV
eukprot:Selendium_serpulae@DN5160_c0_g1_i2.p4